MLAPFLVPLYIITVALSFWLNPFLTICFFVNFTTIIRRIIKDWNYGSRLWVGSFILFWFVFTSSYPKLALKVLNLCNKVHF